MMMAITGGETVIRYLQDKYMAVRSAFASASTPDRKTIGLLPPDGRSSVDVGDIGSGLLGALENMSAYYSYLEPTIPLNVLKYITLISIVNADLSQAVKNARLLGNNGHRIIITAKSTRIHEAAKLRLSDLARNIDPLSAGVDGFINMCFDQLMVPGALSAEAVIAPNMKSVEKVVTVPTFSIRFKYEDSQFRKYQETGNIGGKNWLAPLNELTYSYLAIARAEGSPYAMPPFISALEPLLMQKSIFENVKYMLKKIGLLGLNILTVARLQREQGESLEKWRQRNQTHINDVAKSVHNNYNKGILVLPEGQTCENKPLTQDARGVTEIIQAIEQQVFSGIGADPALFGRSYSTTETYAGVVYNMLLNSLGNMRRLIATFLEKVYMLDLTLNGIPVDNVKLLFNEDKRLDPNTEALAERYRLKNTLDKVNSGMIEPDQGAQEQGYESWYDEEKLKDLNVNPGSETLAFQFDRGLQQYIHLKPAHELHEFTRIKPCHGLTRTDTDNKNKNNPVRECPCSSVAKPFHMQHTEAEQAEEKLNEWIVEYMARVLPYFDEMQSEKVIDWAADYVEKNAQKLKDNPGLFIDDLKQYLGELESYKQIKENKEFGETLEKVHTDMGKFLKTIDLSVFGDNKPKVSIQFGDGDLKAAIMNKRCDNIYFSRFLDNPQFGTQIRAFMSKFFERGESVFGGWTDEIKKDFMVQFGGAIKADLRSQMRLIVESGAGRLQTYSRFEQLYEGGILKAVILVFPGCCSICSSFEGVEVEVARVRNIIREGFVNASSPEAALEFIKSTSVTKDDFGVSVEDLLNSGRGFPKYHPHCKCTIRGIIK
jgi:hypothetical protein